MVFLFIQDVELFLQKTNDQCIMKFYNRFLLDCTRRLQDLNSEIETTKMYFQDTMKYYELQCDNPKDFITFWITFTQQLQPIWTEKVKSLLK